MAGILLVHGAWHGPWCWDGFAERLRRPRPPGPGRAAARPRPAAGPDLASRPPLRRGRGGGGGPLRRAPGAGRALDGRAGGPEVPGARCRPAAVLLAPIPPGGMVAAFGRIAVRHPLILAKANLLLSLRPFVGSSALVREWFFTPDTPGEVVDHCMVRLQDESYPAFLDTLVVLPRPRRVRVPVLVMGAEKDAFFTDGELRRTAAAYRTRSRDRRRHGPRPDARPGLAAGGRPHRQLDPGDPRQTRHRTARTSRTARGREEGT